MQGARHHRRARLISVLCGAALISISALTIWPGCASVPYKTIRKPIGERKPQDFDFLKAGRLTRAEMIRKVGEPDDYYPDMRVACYRVNEVTRRKLVLVFLLPLGRETEVGAADVAFVQFDEDDRAQRFGMVLARFPNGQQRWERVAKEWVADKKK